MTYPLSNLHTHTTFCDGRNTPEEMVGRAIELKWESIGFSGHAYTPCEPRYSMSLDGMSAYFNEITRLKAKYEGIIDIYLGVEQDVFSPDPEFACDYKIGSAHYLNIGNLYPAVDDSPEIAENTVISCFGGDWYKYAEAYYELAAKAAEITGCDIVGHFDLLTKFNEGGRYFNEDDRRYRHAALGAMEHEVKYCRLFEINTGAIYRGRRSVPYPSEFLLRNLADMGAQVILSSDSHDAASLGWRFEDAAYLAARCGFRYLSVLRKGKFEQVKLGL